MQGETGCWVKGADVEDRLSTGGSGGGTHLCRRTCREGDRAHWP